MDMEKITIKEKLDIYNDISNLIYQREHSASNIFNDDKQWKTFHPSDYIVSVNILKEKIKLELMPCITSTGYYSGIWGGMEISFSDFENEERFAEIVTEWKKSLLIKDIDKAKTEMSYEYKRYLELKELFGD